MLSLAVLGTSEFALGFQLAGIKQVIEVSLESKAISKKIKELMSDKNLGVLITEEAVVNHIPDDLKEEMLASVKPSVVVLSKKQGDESLRVMIKKSIGIDIKN